MEEAVNLLNPGQSEQIANGISHLFPILVISAGTVSLILVIYFVVIIILKVSARKRNFKMQDDIAEIRRILEGKARITPHDEHHHPEIHLADGAIKREEGDRI